MKRNLLLCFLIAASSLPSCLNAQQLWSSVLSSSRAINWSNAGVVGGIPSANWTQCGSTIAAYGSSGSPASPATISNALTSCSGTNRYVLLGPGTFYLNGGITFWTSGNPDTNVVLRGSGANQTHIIVSGGACGQGLICMSGSGPEDTVCDWTSGYSQTTTTISLANCGATTPAKGSLSNLHIGSMVILDQVDQASDSGQIWMCDGPTCAQSGSAGLTRKDGPAVNGVTDRNTAQIVVVTNCTNSGGTCTSGANISISPGLYMPTYSSSQAPQAWFPTAMPSGIGVEDLQIDSNQQGVATWNIWMQSCYNCWVKGVATSYPARAFVNWYGCAHCSVVNSYFYQAQNHTTGSYGMECDYGSDNLFMNNIAHQMVDSVPNNEGPCEGNVAAYNFVPYTYYGGGGWFQAAMYQHSAGDAFNLYEGNVVNGYTADSVHGTHHFNTWFRSYLQGWQDQCFGSPCSAQTQAVQLASGSRYFNFIGNSLGTAGYHTQYQCEALNTSQCSAAGSIYSLGFTGNAGAPYVGSMAYCTSPSCGSTSYYDPQTANYLMRWGNYDVVNKAVQWNSSEVPSTISSYGNTVPSSHALPKSFFLSSQPSWWGSTPWPPIGPDVSGGNIGVCSGGTYAKVPALSSGECSGGSLTASAMAGTVYANPAMTCALTVMGMPPDGTGGQLSFNEASCYSASPPSGPPVITSATTVSGTVGSTFSYQITATNSPTSYGATGLPAGLSVNTGTGSISGTPTSAATSTVTLSASNSSGTGSATLTLTIATVAPPAAPVVTSATTAGGTVGSAFSYQITATNSPTSYGATGLPAGLSVNSASGLISGTPSSAATSTVTLGATNSGGTGNATLTLTVTGAAPGPAAPPAPAVTTQ